MTFSVIYHPVFLFLKKFILFPQVIHYAEKIFKECSKANYFNISYMYNKLGMSKNQEIAEEKTINSIFLEI